jgi:hypothetical protein
MSDRDRDGQAESINDPDMREGDPEYGPKPVRSTLQATVRLLLGVVSIAVLGLLVWALLR